jgi:aspartyl-tRNA(Asn)/glutamyl-tRNA(Gln) amidotransferase subunit A
MRRRRRSNRSHRACLARMSETGNKPQISMRPSTSAGALWQRSAADLIGGYERREFSPVEVLDSVLERLDQINPKINAVVTLDRKGAISAAETIEKRWLAREAVGPFGGVPLTVKDNIPVRGMRATWGSNLYTDYVAAADELAIARLRDAGAIILGKTNCPEFALQGYTDNLIFGPTRNPWNLELTPGGSSGGAVAAVSAGIGPIAIGTDGGGSIRRPASHTGLVGLKPSRGRVPRFDGFPAILLHLETLGPMARTVADLCAVMQIITPPDSRDPTSRYFRAEPFQVEPIRPSRILYVPQFADSPVDPEVRANVAAAAQIFAELGHSVDEGKAPFEIEPLAQAWGVIGQVGLAWLLESKSGWQEKITPALAEMAANGKARTGREYFAALNTFKALEQSLSVFFTGYDAILTPTAAALPWPVTEPYPKRIDGQEAGPRTHAAFTGFVNISGCPGISVPCDPAVNGLPIGFQLVAAQGKDGFLCGLAAQFESVHPWTPIAPLL